MSAGLTPARIVHFHTALRRHAVLLLFRDEGLSYDELASVPDPNSASIGTFLSRAQPAFRKEYFNDMANKNELDASDRRRVEKAAGRKAAWAAAGVLAGSAALLAFPAPRGFAHLYAGTGLFQSRAGTPQGVANDKKKLPQMAPDFSLKDASGADIRLSALKGKVVLLNFWATWCGPCKAEIPWFEEFHNTYTGRGLAVVGISMDEEGWKVVKPYMQSAKMNYPVAIGDDALAEKFGGIDSLPETLIIDRAGKIAFRHVGIVAKAEYENEILQLLKK